MDAGNTIQLFMEDSRRYTLALSVYLTQLNIPDQRRVFILAQYSALSLALLAERYKKTQTPYSLGVCLFDSGQIETIKHIPLYASFIQNLQLFKLPHA